jgi:hypothetical protein
MEADIKSIKSQSVSPKPKIDIIKQIGSNVLEIVEPLANLASPMVEFSYRFLE